MPGRAGLFEVTISGVGGEWVMGTVPRDAADHLETLGIEIETVARGDRKELGIPDRLHPFKSTWDRCDDTCHVTGAETCEESRVEVTGSGKSLLRLRLDDSDVNAEEAEEHFAFEQADGTCVFKGRSIEKGVFFSGRIQDESFETGELVLETVDVDGTIIVRRVLYRGEEVRNSGEDTTGRGYEFELIRVGEGSDEGECVATPSGAPVIHPATRPE